MTQLQFRTFFDGTELVVAGRTADKGIQEIGGHVLGTTDDGKQFTFAPHVSPSPATRATYRADPEPA